MTPSTAKYIAPPQKQTIEKKKQNTKTKSPWCFILFHYRTYFLHPGPNLETSDFFNKGLRFFNFFILFN